MLLLLTVVLKVGFVDKRFLVVLVDTVVEEVVMETFEAVVTVDGGSKQRSREQTIRRGFNYARLLPLLHITEGGFVHTRRSYSINRSSIVININHR